MKRISILKWCMKDKIIKGHYIFLLSCSIALAVILFVSVPVSYAATPPPPPEGTYLESTQEYNACIANNGIESTSDEGKNECTYNACANNSVLRLKNCSVIGIIGFLESILRWIVGAAAVISLVTAGLIYATDGGSGERVKLAKKWIINIVIGLIVYALMATILQLLSVT